MLGIPKIIEQNLASWRQLEQHMEVGVDVLTDILYQLGVSSFFTSHARVHCLVFVLVDQRVDFFRIKQLEELTVSGDSLKSL